MVAVVLQAKMTGFGMFVGGGHEDKDQPTPTSNTLSSFLLFSRRSVCRCGPENVAGRCTRRRPHQVLCPWLVKVGDRGDRSPHSTYKTGGVMF